MNLVYCLFDWYFINVIKYVLNIKYKIKRNYSMWKINDGKSFLTLISRDIIYIRILLCIFEYISITWIFLISLFQYNSKLSFLILNNWCRKFILFPITTLFYTFLYFFFYKIFCISYFRFFTLKIYKIKKILQNFSTYSSHICIISAKFLLYLIKRIKSKKKES